MTVTTDGAGFIPLILDPRDAQDLLDSMLADMTAKKPEWTPREGNTEVVLLEGIALLGQELLDALNQVPNATAAGFFARLGVARDTGAAGAALVTFTAGDTLGHDVPPGTRVAVPLPADPSESVIFTTTSGLAIAPGTSTGQVTAVAEAVGTDTNGVPAGTAVDVVDALVYINSAALASPVTGGRDVEGDEDYFARAVQLTNRFSAVLVTDAQFLAFALGTAGVGRAVVVPDYDPGSGNSPGADGGHVTVAVFGSDGAALSADAKAALAAAMDVLAYSQVTPHVIDPTTTTVPVTATVHAFPGVSTSEVQAACVAALSDYLSPGGWSWSGIVRHNELISLLDQVEGVDYVDSIAAPAANVTLSGAASIAVAGTLTITVLAAGA